MTSDTLIINSHNKIQIDSIGEYLKNQSESIKKIAEVIDKISTQDKFLDLVSYDTVFTVTVTLSIFVLGILINRLLKYIDKKKKERKLRKYFKFYIDRITDKMCSKLSEMYRKFYQDINIDSGIPFTPPKILTGDFERMHNIEDKTLFSAIAEKESFSKLQSNIDFVEKLISEIDKSHEHSRKESELLRTPLQEMINDYFDLLSHFVEHIRINQPQYPHCNEFRDLVNNSIIKYHKEFAKTRQLKRLHREIIRPIQEEVVTTNIFRVDLMGFEIADLGKKISNKYSYLKRLTIDFKLGYRKFHKDIDNAQTELKIERSKINWR